jgi:hypothetical protein
VNVHYIALNPSLNHLRPTSQHMFSGICRAQLWLTTNLTLLLQELIVNCCINRLMLWGKEMLRGSNKSVSISVVCSQTSKCFYTAHPLPQCIFCSWSSWQTPEGREWLFLCLLFLDVQGTYKICILANLECTSSWIFTKCSCPKNQHL